MQIATPVNQVRLTNVAVVRMNRHGLRFEVACYKNKILNYRQGIETDLSEVLQIDRVFTNVSKGLLAPSKDLLKAFDTDDQEQVCRIILGKGQVQVSDMERNATLENTAREVANMVATKCVHPVSNRPYTTNQIRDAMKKSEFSVQPTRSVKQQFLDCVKAIQEKGVLPIRRAKMELAIIMPDPSIGGQLVSILKDEAQASIQPSQHKERIQFLIDPSKYRTADTIAKKIGSTLDIVRQIVTQEGDVDVSLELERNTANEQSQIAQQEDIAKIDEDLAADIHELDQELHDFTLGASNQFLGDDDDIYENSPQLSRRQTNKKAQKKSKKAKRREKEEAALRLERMEAEKARRDQREERLDQQCIKVDAPKAFVQNGSGDGSRKSCNTCGGSFTPAEYRAHFRSDWHRYNQQLKLKGVAPIDEKEFLMFDADAFF
jgi:ribosome maturation protein SDO1